MEIWKDIKGYEGIYQISNLGRVKSLERKVNHSKHGKQLINEKILSHGTDNIGRKGVVLCKRGNKKNFRVHQLVAMAFLNHKPNGHILVVDHIDNNPSNNNLSNLQIISCRENNNKDKKKKSSKYRNVYKRKNGKYRVLIYHDKKNNCYGTFKTEEEANIKRKEIINKLKLK